MDDDDPDLFGDLPYQGKGYPDTPGWKEATTSRAAAVLVESLAATVRGEALRALQQARHYSPPGLTPDQVAKAIGRSVLAVRPRITELKLKGCVVRTGERRRNDSGLPAAVWVAVP
jgi:hypothetical protein